jgi:hypothetical protein
MKSEYGWIAAHAASSTRPSMTGGCVFSGSRVATNVRVV